MSSRARRVLVDVTPLQRLGPSSPLGRAIRRTLPGLVAAQAGDWACLLLANGHLGSAPDLPLPDDLPWRLVYSDFPLHRYSPSEWQQHLEPYQSHYESLLQRLAPDLLLRFAPFDMGLPLLARDLTVPTVVYVDDLLFWAMPEAFSEQAPDWQRAATDHAASRLNEADLLLAPNAEIAELLTKALRMPSERIALCPLGPAEAPSVDALSTARQIALSRLGLGPRYLYCGTDRDLRGNLSATLRAYAALPESLRREVPLLLASDWSDDEIWFHYAQAAESDIADDLVIAAPTSPLEHDALLMGAELLLNPRLYDPLGVDLLDAATWGVPVITTQHAPASAIRSGMVTFDPRDPQAMTQALRPALGDGLGPSAPPPKIDSTPTLTDLWPEGDTSIPDAPGHSLDQRQHDAYGDVPLTECKGSTEHKTARSPRKVSIPQANQLFSHPPLRRLALVSPLPPERTGVADFSADLAAALSRQIPVTAYVDPQVLSETEPLPAIEIRGADRLGEDLESGFVDLTLYQVGNSHFHLYQRPLIDRYPGIIEVHDGILHNLCAEAYLPQGDGEGYFDALSFAHGPEGREWAQDVLSGIAPETRQQPTVSRGIVNWALGTIAHNHWAAEAVRAQGTHQPVIVSPIPISLDEGHAALDRAAARRQLGLQDDDLVIATFGRLTPTKRLDALLRAFARLVETAPQARLCLVGALETGSSAGDIPALATELGLDDRLTITGYVDRPTFLAYLAATDIGVNLRYPHSGETSATLTLLLNAGLPVITSNVGPFADLPDDCCWKVDPDESEVDLLYAYLARLAANPALRRTMGQRALTHVQRTIPTWDQAAERYLAFFRECLEDDISGYRLHMLPIDWVDSGPRRKCS